MFLQFPLLAFFLFFFFSFSFLFFLFDKFFPFPFLKKDIPNLALVTIANYHTLFKNYRTIKANNHYSLAYIVRLFRSETSRGGVAELVYGATLRSSILESQSRGGKPRGFESHLHQHFFFLFLFFFNFG